MFHLLFIKNIEHANVIKKKYKQNHLNKINEKLWM